MHDPMDYSISNIGNLFINTASSLLLCWCYWCVARLFKLCETGKPEKPKPSASPPSKPSANTSTANPVTYSIIKMTKIKRISLPQIERAVPGASPCGFHELCCSTFWEAFGLRTPHTRIADASGRTVIPTRRESTCNHPSAHHSLF